VARLSVDAVPVARTLPLKLLLLMPLDELDRRDDKGARLAVALDPALAVVVFALEGFRCLVALLPVLVACKRPPGT